MDEVSVRQEKSMILLVYTHLFLFLQYMTLVENCIFIINNILKFKNSHNSYLELQICTNRKIFIELYKVVH